MTAKTYSEKLKDPRWQKKRLEILQRDEFKCRMCDDSKSTLHVHHLKYSGDPWEIDSCFLITLCEYCHGVESTHYKDSEIDLLNALKEKGVLTVGLSTVQRVIEHTGHIKWEYEPIGDIIIQILKDEKLMERQTKKFWAGIKKRKEVYF